MSDIFDRYEYLKKLWLDFYGLLKMDAESEKMASELDMILVPYENKNGMVDTVTALNKLSGCKSVGIFIGPEGGFDPKEIENAKYSISDIKKGERVKKSPLPFTTSTLQQEASKQLNFSTQKIFQNWNKK